MSVGRQTRLVTAKQFLCSETIINNKV